MPIGRVIVLPGGPSFWRILTRLGPTMAPVAAGVLGVGMMVIAFVVFGPARRRLLAVQDATERLGAGDLDARAPDNGGDEVAAVARSFNKMAVELASRARALDASDNARRQLLADVSHELMTPLTAMRGYIETLGMSELKLDSPTRERYLRIVTDETHRLESIIGDLLDLARLEGGGTSMRRERVDVKAIFARVAARHERELQERGVRLVQRVEPGAEVVVGDPDRLEQALQNLAANALRHTPEGGEIVLSSSVVPDGSMLSVRDTGPGIPEEHLPLIFERFYKVDAARKAAGGSGLGLSIVKAIVERHGGRISARNDNGAVFEIVLPPATDPVSAVMTAVAVWRRVRTVSHCSYNEIRLTVAARPLPASSVGLIPEVIVTLGKRTTAALSSPLPSSYCPGLPRHNDRQHHVRRCHVPFLHGLFMAAACIAGRRSIDLITPARIGMAGTTPTTVTATRSPSRLDSGVVGIRYCGYPYYGYPYGYAYDNSASLRLQVSPREAEVFVDGYYAGTVDDFDGTFQRLHVEPGDHELEVFMPGHRSYQQKVYLQPGKTFNVRHEMEQLGPGDAEPARPVVKSRPTGQPPSRSRRHAPNEPREGDPGAAGPEENLERAPERGPRSEFGSLALRVQPGDARITIDGEPWENSGRQRTVRPSAWTRRSQRADSQGRVSDLHDRYHRASW